MVTSLPFAVRLLLTIGLFLPINYVSLKNYQVVLTSHIPRKKLLLLAFGWFILTILSAVILPEQLVHFLLLLIPVVFAFLFKKWDSSLNYLTNLIVMLFLNFFHLTAYFIGDVVSYYLAFVTNEVLFTYIGLLINLILLYGMWLLLTKTKLATFCQESFTAPASRLLTTFFTISVLIFWIIFIIYYFVPYASLPYFNNQTLQSKMGLAFLITILTLILSFFMTGLMYAQLIRSKISLKEALVEQQNTYLFLLKEVQQDIDLFRVDSQEVLPTIQKELENGQILTSTTLLSEQLTKLDEQTSLNFQQLNALRHIQNIEIKNLLISTILNLQKKAIPFCLDIKDKIPTLLMTAKDTFDCSQAILSNVCHSAIKESASTVCLMVTSLDNLVTFNLSYSLKTQPSFERKTAGVLNIQPTDTEEMLDYLKIIKKYPHIVNKKITTEENYQYIFLVDLSDT